jgi:hypothetical protein
VETGQKVALGLGGASVALLVVGIAVSRGATSSTSSSSPGGGSGGACCPEGEVFTGEMAGSVEMGVTGALEAVCVPEGSTAYPCPCGCTNLTDCGGYTLYSDLGTGKDQWGCCPPDTIYSDGDCVSTTTTPVQITTCSQACCEGPEPRPGDTATGCTFCVDGIGRCHCGPDGCSGPVVATILVGSRSAAGVL